MSKSNLYLDEAKWTIYNTGFDWKGNFANGVAYKLNDVVKYGPSLYICTDDHTSAGSVINLTKFTLFVPGLEWEDTWTAGTSYQPGDIVAYGGYVYTAILISSIVYYNLATRGCVKSVDQIKAEHDAYIQDKEAADEQAKTNNSTTYIAS